MPLPWPLPMLAMLTAPRSLSCKRPHRATPGPCIHCHAHSPHPLQVSDQGDVLYVLPRNLRAVLASKSWWLRAQPAVKGVQEAAAYLVRVTFGTALVTSVVLVWVTILAILSSSSSDKDDRRWAGLLHF